MSLNKETKPNDFAETLVKRASLFTYIFTNGYAYNGFEFRVLHLDLPRLKSSIYPTIYS